MTGYRNCLGSRARAFGHLSVAFGVLLPFLAGCGGGRSYVPRTEFVPFTAEEKVSLESHVSRAYRIQEGDVLKVYFAYERDLNQEGVVVLNDGTISLVGIDPVRVGGLSVAQADSALTEAYSHEYREPALSVMIQETRGRRVYVVGEVRTPGMYILPAGGLDIVNAVTLAGGFANGAAAGHTIVVRVNGEGYTFQEVDLKSLGEPLAIARAAVPLQAYDIVYVPRSRVGSFGYLTQSVLTGLSYITNMAYDLYNVTHGVTGRY